MRKLSPFVLGLSIAVAGSALTAAQETSSMPKVLQITREYIKPYKNGMAHDKTESAFVQAMVKAKFPAYYVGLDSMSGKSRALFLTGYRSFAEWEADNKIVDKNPALAAELERDGIADGELLDSVDSVVYTYSEELSYKPHASLAQAIARTGLRSPRWSRMRTTKPGPAHTGPCMRSVMEPRTAPTSPSVLTSPWPISTPATLKTRNSGMPWAKTA
jgi:hypothetical protein